MKDYVVSELKRANLLEGLADAQEKTARMFRAFTQD